MPIAACRARFGVPQDDPTPAASYSEQRSAMARSIGLGQPRQKTAAKSARPVEAVAGASKA
jgi:predicted transcriptional regulator